MGRGVCSAVSSSRLRESCGSCPSMNREAEEASMRALAGLTYLVLATSALADQPGKIELDTASAAVGKESPRSVALANGSAMTIVIKKKPNEVCRFDYKREEVAPEPSGLEGFLTLLGKAFAPASEVTVCEVPSDFPNLVAPSAKAW